ncbi:hypothetical protein BPOR_0111g00030 [Botrytis porri]|uniref:Uncharacterized protein n=1 Tax=Botrytis porri TaxID=87229 RepID=A0A4Z1KYE4_9HELO|nr:hypothetical protein BPOR_0111g00030 [Botrytis porri]
MPCHTGTGESSTPVHTHDIRKSSATVDLTVLPVQGNFKPKAAIRLFDQSEFLYRLMKFSIESKTPKISCVIVRTAYYRAPG